MESGQNKKNGFLEEDPLGVSVEKEFPYERAFQASQLLFFYFCITMHEFTRDQFSTIPPSNTENIGPAIELLTLYHLSRAINNIIPQSIHGDLLQVVMNRNDCILGLTF